MWEVAHSRHSVILAFFRDWDKSEEEAGRKTWEEEKEEKRKDFKEEENGECWFKSALQGRWAGGWELGKPLFADVKDTENPHHLLPRKGFSASVIYSPTPHSYTCLLFLF